MLEILAEARLVIEIQFVLNLLHILSGKAKDIFCLKEDEVVNPMLSAISCCVL